MSGRDEHPQDIDTHLREQTNLLISEMDSLLRRAKALLSEQRQYIAAMRERRELRRESRKEQ